MSNPDRVEFYGNDQLIAALNTSIVPPRDSLINIRGKTWRVDLITYAIDHSDDEARKAIRVNVELEWPL